MVNGRFTRRIMISLPLLFTFLGGLVVVTTASDAWRSNCAILENRYAAPFLYLSQSEIAVLAYYSNVDYQRFKNRMPVDIYITPICFIKGYTDDPYLTIESGTQRCRMTPLSPLIEFPTLFFLRRKPYSHKWILLNSGEHQHIAGNKGIMLGVGVAPDFIKTCGVSRRRIAVDEPSCASVKCKDYCNYKVAPANNCMDKRTILRRYMSERDIPQDMPAYDTSYVPPKTPSGSVESKSNARSSDEKGEASRQKYVDGRASGNGTRLVVATKGGNTSSTLSDAIHTIVLCLVGVGIILSR